MIDTGLPITEELDFSYLLELLPPLYKEPGFEWLPELFSIIGYERLLMLSKYAGGELIRIPTLEEISISLESLQYFYFINISKTKTIADIPVRLVSTYKKICEIYDVRNS